MATNETVTPHRDRRTDLLDPATLAQLGGIDIIARQVVHGFLLGAAPVAEPWILGRVRGKPGLPAGG